MIYIVEDRTFSKTMIITKYFFIDGNAILLMKKQYAIC